MEIIRATRTAQQAGAYYVRIQAMARKHRIPLDVEFDEHDTPDSLYIVVVDDYLPVATCRLYGLDSRHVMLGRIVVIPEYRHRGLGSLVVKEAEKWAKELKNRIDETEEETEEAADHRGGLHARQPQGGPDRRDRRARTPCLLP